MDLENNNMNDKINNDVNNDINNDVNNEVNNEINNNVNDDANNGVNNGVNNEVNNEVNNNVNDDANSILIDNKKDILNEKENRKLVDFIKMYQIKFFANNNFFTRKNYNLFINKIIYDVNDDCDLYNLAIYYFTIDFNKDIVIKYCSRLIDKGNINAIIMLGFFYRRYFETGDENNTEYVGYNLSTKYFLMAINKGSVDAMVMLGSYYRQDGNFPQMKKYYLMAINKDCSTAMYKLGCHYLFENKNYDLAKKYLFMAISKDNPKAMLNLGYLYKKEHTYDLAIKYYLTAINKGYAPAMYSLGFLYENIKNIILMKEYYIKSIYNGNESAMARLGSYYSFHGTLNYRDAYNYFDAIINSKSKLSLKYNVLPDDFIYPVDSCGLNCKHLIKKSIIIDVFCELIDNKKIIIKIFKFFVTRIIEHITSCKIHDECDYKLKNLNHFMEYMGKLYFKKNNGNKYHECLNNIIKKGYFTVSDRNNYDTIINNSQIFMEYLTINYYKYIGKKYSPGGKEYDKIKKHFETFRKNIIQNNESLL